MMKSASVRRQCILLLHLASWQVAAAELLLPTFISDSMVLQREPQRARLWGWTTDGFANITAQLDGVIVANGVADINGTWTIDLPPQAAGGNHTITLSYLHHRKNIFDVTFGDVYLCSGQSNMVFGVQEVFNATAEIDDSLNYPFLRIATVERVESDAPMYDNPSGGDYVWARSGPDALGDKDEDGDWFSALCYFFGRDLYTFLKGQVPIGLISASWGGKKIECFSSPDALADATCGGTQPGSTRATHRGGSDEEQGIQTRSDNMPKETDDTKIWNGMIHPLLNMRFSGVMWYQGEANCKELESYACLFPGMIADWRSKFQLPDLVFNYVQMAARPRSNFHLLRASQDAALALPNVGVVHAIDLGDPTAPRTPIHPRRKQEVGRRLALKTLALYYKHEDIEDEGPILETVEQQPGRGVVLGFRSARGLHLHGTAACNECCHYQSPFEILTPSGYWIPASAAVINETAVYVSSPEIVGVRLEWEGYPQCALYNGIGGPEDRAGLPAPPFEWCAYRTGDAPWTDSACGLKGSRDSMFELLH